MLSSIKEITDLTKDMRNDQGNSFQSHFDLYWSPSTDCIFLKGNEIEEDSCLQNISNFLNCLIIITHSETESTGVSQQTTLYRPFHANELSHRV